MVVDYKEIRCDFNSGDKRYPENCHCHTDESFE